MVFFSQKPNKHLTGQGCPICKESHGERKIRNFLNKYNIKHKGQHMFEDCINIFPLPFDFYLVDLNILIEYDGIQHFDKNSLFYSEEVIINDEIKKQILFR